jgi:hypothetical protein
METGKDIMEILEPPCKNDYIGTFRCGACGCLFKQNEKEFLCVINIKNHTYSYDLMVECICKKQYAWGINIPVNVLDRVMSNPSKVVIWPYQCEKFHSISSIKTELYGSCLCGGTFLQKMIYCKHCDTDHFIDLRNLRPVIQKYIDDHLAGIKLDEKKWQQ